MTPGDASRVLRAGVLTAITDGIFSSVLNVVFYGSTVTRLFQGVAYTLIGAEVFRGGTRTALIGVLMHFGVALGWSAFFIVVLMRWGRIRRMLAAPHGVLRLAALYGPFVWLVMSLAIIPALLHGPPSITVRWWVQLIGHIPFVGLPIVRVARGGMR